VLVNSANNRSVKSHIMIHLDGKEGGGIRTISEAWYRGFVQRGVHVSYLMNRNGIYARELYDKGREIYCADMGEIRNVSRNIAGIRMPDVVGWSRSMYARRRVRNRFEDILQDVKPDVVLGNGASSAAIIGPACKTCGVDLVSCFHGISHPSDFLAIRKRVIAYLVNGYCRKIIGVSQATLASIIPYLGVPYGVIYNSVPEIVVSEFHRQRLRKMWNISDKTVVFGSASRITASKAILRFVDAGKNFMASNPFAPVVFLIAGEPRSKNDQEYLDTILKKINRENLQAKILYVGYQPIADFYSAIDVFCHTHEGVEPLGLTVVEALSACLPVIVCDKGGFLEFLPDDIGIRYDGASHIKLAEAMQRMLDVSLRKEQSEKGRNFISSGYISYSQWIDAWLNILNNYKLMNITI